MERTPGMYLTEVIMPVSLPSNANLGHLKKQAKHLLKAGRNHQSEAQRRFITYHPDYASGIPDCTKLRLQEAQLVIAREYGVSSWAKIVEMTGPDRSAPLVDASGILLITNGNHTINRLETAQVPGV